MSETEPTPERTGEEVLVEREGGLVVITINRPEARNAVSQAVAEGVSAALDELDADPDLRVGIITGAGGTFCAGMDLMAFLRGDRSRTDTRGFAGIVERPPAKPLIGAVEGYALAGGFEILMSCDLIVAAEDATFGIPEVKRGLIAAGGGLFRLPERIPYYQAMELVLTGDLFSAKRANELGLVNRLVPPGTALPAARELAATILANAPLAVQGSRKIIVDSRGWPRDEFFARQAEINGPVRSSEDSREGATAFKEKRPPVWRAR